MRDNLNIDHYEKLTQLFINSLTQQIGSFFCVVVKRIASSRSNTNYLIVFTFQSQ